MLGTGRITALTAVAINLLASTWQFAGNRARASGYLARGVHSGEREQQAIWDFTRPLVAATLAGAFVGDATTGIIVGATLELVEGHTLPGLQALDGASVTA